MTSLTFYGGINEIGGNKILLEDNKAKIWLDFGMSYSQFYKYYAEFLVPRKYNALKDFFEFNLTPDLKGLYRDDFLKKMRRKPVKKLNYDAVFLSHAHLDHSAYITHLHKDMPIYCGKTTKLILQAMQDTGSGSFNDYIIYKEAFVTRNNKAIPKYPRNIITFRTKDKIQIKDLTIEPVHVDHSLPGSYGFIIHTSKGPVVYTGDFRLHGRKKSLTEDFIKKAEKEQPVVMICEGTRIKEPMPKKCPKCGYEWDKISRTMDMTEAEVKQKITKLIADTKGLVVANFPPRDLDRLNTFYKAAKENDRKLVIDFKQAYLLKLLEEDEKLNVPKINDKNIIIFAEKSRFGTIVEEEIPFEEQVKDYYAWQRPFLELKNCLHCEDLKNMQKEIVFYCSFFDLGHLIDIRPIKGSNYIYSLCEPFNEEMVLDFERIKRWLEHFKLPLHMAHASGHANKEKIKEVIERINPKTVIPVHTEGAEEFRKIYKNVKLVKANKKINI